MPTRKPFERRWISIREASEFLGISTITAYRWVRSGKIKATQFGRCVRVDLRALEHLSNIQPRPTAQPQNSSTK